jgi:NAD(P)-dependent dehydrogenase (short-subunit alcohol dehydrogenase family)
MSDERSRGVRSFHDAVAIVTGGASGIGAALGRELARQGARVVLADRQLDLASEIAASINRAGGKAEAAELDVRDAIAFDAIVALTIERHGRLDYLFNNAGIAIGGEIREYRLDDWRDVVDVNLMGVVHGVQASYGRMIAQGFGHIVNTASVAGLLPSPFMGSYTTTKHAVVGLSRALRAEAARYGVRVSALCPGVIRTPILTGGRFGRMAQPMDLGLTLKIWEELRPIEPEDFALRALRLVAQNRGIIIVPGWWRLVCWLNGTASQLFERGVASRLQKIISQVIKPGASPSRRTGSEAPPPPRDQRTGS